VDYVNGATCVFAGLIWAVITRPFVPDTNLGVAIVLVPCGILVVVGAYMTGMARINRINKWK
jgi:hypothetical protein